MNVFHRTPSRLFEPHGKRRQPDHQRLKRWAVPLTLLVLGFFAWLPLQGQLSKNIKTKNFNYPEFYEHTIAPGNPTNRMKLLLRGSLGQYLSNSVSGITTARLEHYPESGKGTNLIAVSPFCLLDADAHTVYSTGRVDIAANDGAITIHGDNGFHFDMTNHVLYVSNHNRTVILHGLFQKP
ncbi:MAG: hypothetical protein QOF48_339 [Verrucomicrobiota bacterium]